MTAARSMIGSRYLLPNGIYTISLLGDTGSKRKSPSPIARGLFPVLPNTLVLGDSGNTGSKRNGGGLFRGRTDD